MLKTISLEHGTVGNRGFGRGVDGVMETRRTIRVHKGGGRRMLPCIGTVNLFRGGLTDEIVTHEFAHAMFAYGERKRWMEKGSLGRPIMAIEELYCYALGRMVARFWRRARVLGLLG